MSAANRAARHLRRRPGLSRSRRRLKWAEAQRARWVARPTQAAAAAEEHLTSTPRRVSVAADRLQVIPAAVVPNVTSDGARSPARSRAFHWGCWSEDAVPV